jgi:hypothetical protein
MTKERQIEWIRSQLPDALAAEELYQTPANVQVAIAGHESNWGSSKVAREKNNLHGIMRGLEHRKFDSPAQSYLFCAKLLAQDPRYALARKKVFEFEATGAPAWQVERKWIESVASMYLTGREREDVGRGSTSQNQLGRIPRFVRKWRFLARLLVLLRQKISFLDRLIPNDLRLDRAVNDWIADTLLIHKRVLEARK